MGDPGAGDAPGVRGGSPGWDDFAFALTSGDTRPLRGFCPWQLWATRGTVSQIVGTGTLSATPGLELVTHEERVLEAALERLAQDDEVEITIFDRTLVLKDPAKVQALIDHFRTWA